MYWNLLYWEAIHWIGNYWIWKLTGGIFIIWMGFVLYDSEPVQDLRKARFFKNMEKYLDSGYVYRIIDQIVKNEHSVNTHKIYDEIVRQERMKGEINSVRTKKRNNI
jgi:hypothetical protein